MLLTNVYFSFYYFFRNTKRSHRVKEGNLVLVTWDQPIHIPFNEFNLIFVTQHLGLGDCCVLLLLVAVDNLLALHFVVNFCSWPELNIPIPALASIMVLLFSCSKTNKGTQFVYHACQSVYAYRISGWNLIGTKL